jgi:S1-C subfamily serine protease
VEYTEKDVSRDPVAAQEMVRRSGQRGVPVIAVDDQIIVGFNRPLLEQALSRKRFELGVSVADAAKLKQKYRLSVSEGALVGAVKPGSLAAEAGLQAGDVILEIAGTPIRTAQDVTDVTVRLKGMRETSISWVRGDKSMKGKARL